MAKKSFVERILRKAGFNKEIEVGSRDFEIAFMHFVEGNYDKLTPVQRKILCDNMKCIDNKNITLREICNGLGINVPEQFKSMADKKQSLDFDHRKVKRGAICMILRSAEDLKHPSKTSKDQYEEAKERGAKLIIMDEKAFKKANLKEKDYPVLLVDNYNIRILRFFSILRKQEKAKVVMVTGSVGKTTTKDICATVVEDRFNTFYNKRNTNSIHQVSKKFLHETNNNNEVYIQEAGAGKRGSVRLSASILQPDIFILMNVLDHHLQSYKTMEALFADKASADDYMKKDGIIITNYDDEGIRNHIFKHQVISFGIENADVDYRAVNVQQKNEFLCFDIFERKTGETIKNVKIKMMGEHNVYNTLAAFVLGRTLGLSNDMIKHDLKKYETAGIRQNFTNVGGVHIFMDCYNVAESSILSMLEIGEKFEVSPGAEKIALIGGENKIGKAVVERSEAFGTEVAKYKIDKFLFCGTKERTSKALNKYGDGESIRNAFMKACETPSEIAFSIDDMIHFLKENVKSGDLLLVKGIYKLDMVIAVDKVLGTSFSFGESNYKEAMKKFSSKSYQLGLIEELGEMEIHSAPVKEGKLVIPKNIEDYPVFRIKNKAFANKADITAVNLGKSVKNIGAEAFYKCINLENVVFSSNVKVIESQAFAGCSNLKSVALEEGVTHIAFGAFENCDKLEEITIPASVGRIEEEAFQGCNNLEIICKENSFAHEYAKDNNINFRFK